MSDPIFSMLILRWIDNVEARDNFRLFPDRECVVCDQPFPADNGMGCIGCGEHTMCEQCWAEHRASCED